MIAVVKAYGKLEDVELESSRGCFADYLGICTCLQPVYYLHSILVILNLLVASIVAWALSDYYQDHSYNNFEIPARWISATVGGLVFLVALHTIQTGKGLRGPFQRSTCELFVYNPHHSLASHLNRFYFGLVFVANTNDVEEESHWFGTHRNKLRVPLLMIHLFVCGAVFGIYSSLMDITDRIRNIIYIIVIVTPTLTGLIDFAKVKQLNTDSWLTNAPRGRLYWSTLSLALKASIYACIVLVVHPEADTKQGVVWAITALLGYVVVSFWATMAFLTTQALGILNIPPELDFSDVLRNDEHPQQSQRLTTQQKQETNKPATGFVIELK